MNQRRTSWGFSQFLAAGVVVSAVLIMLAPFRGGDDLTRMRSAAVLPILSTAAIAHGDSFQAFHSSDRVCVSDSSQFRSAATAKRLQRREIVVRKSAGPPADQFQAPRTGWHHLDRPARAALDRLVAGWRGNAVVLRGSGLRSGGLNELERLSRTLRPGARIGRAVLLGNGSGLGDGRVVVREEDGAAAEEPLSLYLSGDFHQQAPTLAQWQALDEVLDYLELKRGRLQVLVDGEGESPRAGPGPLFPAKSVLQALARPGS